MKINKKNGLKGFTLVELIVVIAIIGVLASILVPNMMGYIQKANVKRAVADAKTVQNVLSTEVTSYFINNSSTQKTNLDNVKTKSNSTAGCRIDDPNDIFFQGTLGSTYTGIIYKFDYSDTGFKFAYTTKTLENVYMVYYNFDDASVDSNYNIVEKSTFTIAKKK